MDYCILLTSNLDSRYLNNVNMLKVNCMDRPLCDVDIF